jgi:hypothetical protein
MAKSKIKFGGSTVFVAQIVVVVAIVVMVYNALLKNGYIDVAGLWAFASGMFVGLLSTRFFMKGD